MNKIKKKIKNFIEFLPFLTIQLLPFIVIGILWLMAYLVAISDLPDWFKFFLLR